MRRRLAFASIALGVLGALGAGAAITACDAVLGIPNRQLFANAVDCTSGGCMCSLGFGDCDNDPANGCEAQLNSDGAHCGACTHDCFGGACLAGRCQPLQLGLHSVSLVVKSGGSIYIGGCNDPTQGCTSEPALVEVPDKCQPYAPCSTTLWPESPTVLLSVGVAENDAYWTDESFVSYTGPLDGGLPHTLGQISNLGVVLGASGTTLYYTEADPNSPVLSTAGLYRASVAGGTVGPSTTITTDFMTAFSLDAMNVYYIDAGNLYACPHDQTIPMPLAANVGGGPLVLDGSTLYVGGASIRSVPIDGGSPTIVVPDTGTSSMRGLALDDTYFYWGGTPVGLSRAPREGGSPESLVADTAVGPVTLAVDDRAIYWASVAHVAPGLLQMLAK